MEKNTPSVKFFSVIFGLSVNTTIIKKIFITDEFIDGKARQKNLPVLFRRYFPREACLI